MRKIRGIVLTCLLSTMWPARPATALDIVLTNDDGFESALTWVLYERLVAAGHRVLISASVADQSGRGGYADFLRAIGPLAESSRGGCLVPTGTQSIPGTGHLGLGAPLVLEACPRDANVFWVNGAPVTAALYGMDVAAPARFGKSADLVISGPNYGTNAGPFVNTSGTVNAALVAVNRGLPAVAVSAAEPFQYRSFRDPRGATDVEIADLAVRLVRELERARRGTNAPLLPAGTGLNVNLPKFAAGEASGLKWVASRVGRAGTATLVFSEDLCAEALGRILMTAACTGETHAKQPGVGFVPPGKTQPDGSTSIADADPLTEQNVVSSGRIAVTVLQGAHAAPSDTATRVARLLRGLK